MSYYFSLNGGEMKKELTLGTILILTGLSNLRSDEDGWCNENDYNLRAYVNQFGQTYQSRQFQGCCDCTIDNCNNPEKGNPHPGYTAADARCAGSCGGPTSGPESQRCICLWNKWDPVPHKNGWCAGNGPFERFKAYCPDGYWIRHTPGCYECRAACQTEPNTQLDEVICAGSCGGPTSGPESQRCVCKGRRFKVSKPIEKG